ncbi:MAG TPA: hypothetical protein VFS39_12020 [Nitrospira sp.]|nr:hypothetical protein [Nitrospira sp.]
MSAVRALVWGVIILLFALPLSSTVAFKLFAGQRAETLGLSWFNLAGEIPEVDKPQFSLRHWVNRSFQDQSNKWFTRYFGGRSIFIKSGNQVIYTLFKHSYMHNQSIVIGKQGELYESWYVYDYCRLSEPMPDRNLEDRVADIAELQERLKARGIIFLFLITPSKAAVYPESIPEAYCKSPKSSTRDYENVLPLLKAYGISYVDGHAISTEARTIEPLPLFSRGGTHWNTLGAYYTVRELVKTIGTLLAEPVGSMSVEKIQVDSTPRGQDKDLAQLLNLLFPPFDYAVPRPVIVQTPTRVQLEKALVVGTSFNWTVLDLLANSNVFERIDFYYYYKLGLYTFPGKIPHVFDVATHDWDQAMRGSRIVILEVNEAGFQTEYIQSFLRDVLEDLQEKRSRVESTRSPE